MVKQLQAKSDHRLMSQCACLSQNRDAIDLVEKLHKIAKHNCLSKGAFRIVSIFPGAQCAEMKGESEAGGWGSDFIFKSRMMLPCRLKRDQQLWKSKAW